jgi:hypothetical protein
LQNARTPEEDRPIQRLIENGVTFLPKKNQLL